LLTDAGYGVVSGKASLISDDVLQEISDTLTFTNAVLYDATSGNPLVWYPAETSTIEKDSMVIFEFSKGIVILDS
jgi:hypothetical protein